MNPDGHDDDPVAPAAINNARDMTLSNSISSLQHHHHPTWTWP